LNQTESNEIKIHENTQNIRGSWTKTSWFEFWQKKINSEVMIPKTCPMDHSGQRVWGVSHSLYAKDIFCRKKKNILFRPFWFWAYLMKFVRENDKHQDYNNNDPHVSKLPSCVGGIVLAGPIWLPLSIVYKCIYQLPYLIWEGGEEDGRILDIKNW
jgi:hypothetical protein